MTAFYELNGDQLQRRLRARGQSLYLRGHDVRPLPARP